MRPISAASGCILFLALICLILCRPETAAAEAGAIVSSDYGIDIRLPASEWTLTPAKPDSDSDVGSYYYGYFTSSDDRNYVQVFAQHMSDFVDPGASFDAWLAQVEAAFMKSYVSGLPYRQQGTDETAAVTLGSGQQVDVVYRTFVVNGHWRHIAAFGYDFGATRVLIGIVNSGFNEDLHDLAPLVAKAVRLSPPS